jgi:hypothetical protein
MQHWREGWPPRAQAPADEEVDLRLLLVENKSNPSSIKSRSANQWLQHRYLIRDRSMGRTFLVFFFKIEGERDIRFSKEKKHNFRGAFAKNNLPHHQTNGGRYGLTKTLVCGNFDLQFHD